MDWHLPRKAKTCVVLLNALAQRLRPVDDAERGEIHAYSSLTIKKLQPHPRSKELYHEATPLARNAK
ncbi:hypothetical protein Tco_0598385 [Tanacetum coccineum]